MVILAMASERLDTCGAAAGTPEAPSAAGAATLFIGYLFFNRVARGETKIEDSAVSPCCDVGQKAAGRTSSSPHDPTITSIIHLE